MRFVYIPVSLAQVARFLSKEVCLYAGTDWLKLSCQSEGGEGLVAKSDTGVNVKLYPTVRFCARISLTTLTTQNAPEMKGLPSLVEFGCIIGRVCLPCIYS